MDRIKSSKLFAEVLKNAIPIKVIRSWPDKYIRVSLLERVWLFLTLRKPPINPEWQKIMDGWSGSGTVKFRRTLPWGK